MPQLESAAYYRSQLTEAANEAHDYRTPQSDARDARLDAMADAFDVLGSPEFRIESVKAELVLIPCFIFEATGEMMTREQKVLKAEAIQTRDAQLAWDVDFDCACDYADAKIDGLVNWNDLTPADAERAEALLAEWNRYDAEEAEEAAA